MMETEANPTPLNTAEVEPVEILRLAAGGDGVGRWGDGRSVFVPRTAPGDVVEVVAHRVYRRRIAGRLRRVISAGAGRVSPRCAHYDGDGCGGCQLQHVDLPVQHQAKSAMVGDALRRIGKIDWPDPEVVSDGAPWAYRNKITLARTASGDGFGFHRWDRPDQVFRLRRCEIAAADLTALWTTILQHLAAIPPDVDRMVLRLDRDGARHVVASAPGSGDWAEAAQLASALEADGLPTSVWYQPAGGSVRLLAGPGSDHRATVFEQVNSTMGAQVRRDAIAELGSVTGQHVWDLYAGVGDASRLLAEAGATVEAVERDPLAGEARQAAGGLPITWYQGEVESMLTVLRPSDQVLVNPPRTGLSRVASGRLADRGPRRIVYVSCDPATLARDLGHLVACGAGYRVTHVRAYDLFPQTAHVETVARVDRP